MKDQISVDGALVWGTTALFIVGLLFPIFQQYAEIPQSHQLSIDGVSVGTGPADAAEEAPLPLEWVEDPRHFDINGTYISDMDWNPDYTLLAVATGSPEISIIDPRRWPDYRAVRVPDLFSYSLSWSPDGEQLAVAGNDDRVLIFNTSDWTVVRNLSLTWKEGLIAIDYGPLGDMLAIGRGNEIRIIRTSDWTVHISTVYKDLEEIRKLTWSPDGSYIYMGGDGMWLVTAKDLRVLDSRPFDFIETCWSPDSRYYVNTHITGIANVAQADPWEVVKTLYANNPHDPVHDASWIQDGSLLVTCKETGWITIWNTTTWRPTYTIYPKEPVVTQVSWWSDRRLLASGDVNMDVIFWRLTSERVLKIHGGERLYADYQAYDFEVDANPYELSDIPSDVRLVLDPTGANVSLKSGFKFGGAYIVEESDPLGLVALESDFSDIQRDPLNETVHVHFRIRFSWDWPHEDPCDVGVEAYLDGVPLWNITVFDRFSVENDLEFAGELVASGEWQGSLAEEDWVRSSEPITVSGPVVVYQGSGSVYPPEGLFKARLADDDGNSSVAPVVKGETIRLSLLSDPCTDPDETLVLDLIELPGKAELASVLDFNIRVDGDAPRFTNMLPDDENWNSVSLVAVSATTDDGETAGIDVTSLEYSCSDKGVEGFGGWTREGLEITRTGDAVEAQTTIRLPDGEENYIRWRVRDLVGNLAQTDPLRIRVDTVNVTFSDPLPGEYAWLSVLTCECGVTITDIAGSGIDVSTIQYRVSPRNLSQYCDWIDWEEGARQDAQVVVVRTDVTFILSTYNYVQWRAMDIAGNGFTTSPHYRVMIDVEPIAFRDFEPTEDLMCKDSTVQCWVTAYDPPGGSGVDFARLEFRHCLDGGAFTNWSSTLMNGVKQEVRFSVWASLDDGLLNRVQFRGYDVAGNGPTLSREYTVRVDATGPEFRILSPDTTAKQAGHLVTIEFEVWDELGGVDPSTVEYRFCTHGESSLGGWIKVEVRPISAAHYGSFRVNLAEGRGNVVMLRAGDLIGNLAESTPFDIWVNGPPCAVISSPGPGQAFGESDQIPLDASGTTDPDGDALTYSWSLDGANETLLDGSSGFARLEPGVHILKLSVTDDCGAKDVVTVQVIVEASPPPRTREEGGNDMWKIVVIILIAAIVSAILVLYKRHSQSLGP